MTYLAIFAVMLLAIAAIPLSWHGQDQAELYSDRRRKFHEHFFQVTQYISAFILLICSMLLMAGCASTETPVNKGSGHTFVPTDASVPGSQPYECRSDCQCDLNYCPDELEPIEGHWEAGSFIEWIEDDDGRVREEVAYPRIDEHGCLHSVEATFTAISSHREYNGYWVDFYGTLYIDILFTADCPFGTSEDRLNYSYYYWDLYNPYFLSGLTLHDHPVSGWAFYGIGATLYFLNEDVKDETAFFIRIPELWGYFQLRRSGVVGECSPGQLHCYRGEHCTDLAADCVDSMEQCESLGGASYSTHKDGHEWENCSPVNPIVR